MAIMLKISDLLVLELNEIVCFKKYVFLIMYTDFKDILYIMINPWPDNKIFDCPNWKHLQTPK